MIGICNLDFNMVSELSKYIELRDMSGSSDFPKIDGLIIDWVDKSHTNFIAQAAIVEHYARESIPIIIYDRYMCIVPKEHGWLKKFNVEFFEPAFNNREGYEYLPQWTDLTYELEETHFDLGYIGPLNRRVKLFEKYYRDVATLWPNLNVKYEETDVMNEEKETEWRNDGIFKDRHHDDYDFNFTILIDSPDIIEIGCLPPNLFKLMKHGVVPICPIEQKYFQGMFQGLVVSKPSEVEWYLRSFKDLREVLLDGIYKTISTQYPEFTLEYACDKIKRKLMI
jgi:hypothetical protein